MKNIKMPLLGALMVLGVSAGAGSASAQDGWRYVPYWDIYPLHKSYNNPQVPHLTAEQVQELRFYLEYEEREPCQNYLPPPDGFYRIGCDLMVRYAEPRPPVRQVTQTTQTIVQQRREVLADYEIHFAFDSAVIEAAAYPVIDRIAAEITTYHPGEVTVAGHTDKSGSNDYNLALSQRRAEAVSRALSDRGVPNRVIDQQAHGENAPAVDTPDGVKLRENRRVVVEFLK